VKKTVPFFTKGIVCFFVLFFWASTIQAANPATIDVTVTIQNLSVSATGPIAFGTVVAGDTSVSTDSSHVVNDGNVTETYSLDLTDPGGWTAVQAAPGSEEYCLSAQFNSSQPTEGSFTYEEIFLENVGSGEIYDVEKNTGLVLKINNPNEREQIFQLQSLTVGNSVATLTKKYQDAPDASYLKFSESRFVLPPAGTKTIKMYLRFPPGKEHSGKKYLFVIHAFTVDQKVTTGVYSRLYASIK
jgi:hypothetical protein